MFTLAVALLAIVVYCPVFGALAYPSEWKES
jgi:hypothetical protein